jgi:hypothetical protein
MILEKPLKKKSINKMFKVLLVYDRAYRILRMPKCIIRKK